MRGLRRQSRRNRGDDFDREVAFHIDALARDYEARGLSAEAARRQARVDFGGSEQITQQLREVHLSVFLEVVRANLRAAFRFLRKAPGLSAAVILTLALGIGANTAVFSAIYAVILRPLAFPHGNELMIIQQYDTRGKSPVSWVAPIRLEDWNRLSHTFQAMTGYYAQDETEISGPLPEHLENIVVAPRFLEVWGIAPQLGRDFSPAEEHYGGPNAILISHRFWMRRFHGNPDVLGKQLHFGGDAYTIIGIMPASFAFPRQSADIFTPNAPDAPYAQSRASTWFNVVGRLRPGVTQRQAFADLAAVQSQLGLRFPKTDRDLGIHIAPLKDQIVGNIGSSLWLLYGAVTLLLLIACINIAALLLARTAGRSQELSMRFALGASRRTVILQLLSEVLLLALIGAAFGVMLAAGAVALLHHGAATLPRVAEIAIDWRLMLYTFVCALAVTLAAGLYPALRATRGDLARALTSSGRTQISARGGLQWLLVGAQVALAVTLLVGAGLMLRSFAAIGRVSPGFESAHVLTLQISAGWGETGDMNRLTQRIDHDLEALRSIPGVNAAATSDWLPGMPGQPQIELALVEGEQDESHRIIAITRFVSSGYFHTLGIPILQGQDCVDNNGGPPAVLVNHSFANRYLQQVTPLGSHLKTVAQGVIMPTGEIRGIVGDAREDGVNSAPSPTVYPCDSASMPSPWFLIRTYSDPMAMANAIRQKLHQVEPSRSIFAISPLTDHISDALTENRTRTDVLAFFAGTAISLACLGLYGTLSYLGRMRRREMGLRLAIGATRSQIVGSLLAQGLRIVAIGCAAGLAMGLAASHLIRGMLYAVTPTDPETYAAIVLLVVVVATAACLGPALRAAGTDPAEVLREE